MFTNILKWTFKIVVDGIEKELNIHLDGDTPLQAIEQTAMQMIAHCSKIKDMQAAQVAAQQPVAVDPEQPVEVPSVGQEQTPAE
jgi:hypothetical protein